MRSGAVPVAARLDFLHAGPPRWDITIETADGIWQLVEGGARLLHDGVAVPMDTAATTLGEYPGLYRRFAALIAAGESDCDVRPLELVADAFMLGERRTVAPFSF
jgi:D-galactose 1-dehydrogenase